MKRLAVLVAVATAFAACSGADTGDSAHAPDTTATTDTTVEGSGEVSAPLMATALEELVTEGETFGGDPPAFTEYLIQSGTDPAAGSARGDRGEARPLTTAEREAVEQVIRPLGPVRWIDGPAEWWTADLRPVVEGSVILGVGEPAVDGDRALVPVSLWCGGLCGTWLTYRLDRTDDTWRVTGTEGPITIA